MAEVFVLENQHVRLIAQQQGARVKSLIDKRTGREWLVQAGGLPSHADDPGGWDECFPNIAPVSGGTPWRRPLRNHGELRGQPWVIEEANTGRLTTRFSTPEFTFVRMLELFGPTVECTYEVVTAGRRALPFIWAQHALLAVTPEDRIDMPGVKTVDAGYLVLGKEQRPPQTYAWPGPGGVLRMPFDTVYPAEQRFVAKFYARAPRTPLVSVGNAGGWLDFTWDAREVPHVGLWLNFGGWPAERPLHHLAIEPTTASTDKLEDVIAGQRRFILTRNRPFVWTVKLTLRR